MEVARLFAGTGSAAAARGSGRGFTREAAYVLQPGGAGVVSAGAPLTPCNLMGALGKLCGVGGASGS